MEVRRAKVGPSKGLQMAASPALMSSSSSVSAFTVSTTADELLRLCKGAD
jgi:hypothetical protein